MVQLHKVKRRNDIKQLNCLFSSEKNKFILNFAFNNDCNYVLTIFNVRAVGRCLCSI